MRRSLSILFLLLVITCPAVGQEIIDAARAGDLAGVKSLVETDKTAVGVTDDRQCTALHFALNGGFAAMATFLIDNGADIMARDVDGDTPLHWVACTENIQLADLLMKAGVEINALNNSQSTPFMYATQRHQYAMVEKLAAGGADFELANDYGRTPLIYNTREGGDLEMARLLLRLGANVNALDRFNDSSLELAAWRGFETLVGILLDAGAQTDTVPEMSNDLLNHAANHGLERLYQQLITDGVVIDVASGEYSSLIHVAAGGGSAAIVKDLLSRGAQPDARDMNGWTPLHHAADRKRQAVVQTLVDGGSSRDTRSHSGHSPLSLATFRNAEETVKILEQAGHSTSNRDFPRLTGDFLGQGAPPTEPAAFATDIVANCWGEHGSISFTPDGKEAFWASYQAIPDSGYSISSIVTSRIKDGRWTAPEPAPFLGEHLGDVPFAAPDDRRVFFISRHPLVPGGRTGKENIWVVEREGSNWGEPRPLPPCVNEMPHHWQISVAANGNLYFHSQKPQPGTSGVYVSRPVNGEYTEPEFLGFSGSTPYINPEENILITSESYGQENIIRFRLEDGNWSTPQSITDLYPGVGGICPKLSPDARAFIFLSHRTGITNNFWVDAGFLDDLKKQVGLQ